MHKHEKIDIPVIDSFIKKFAEMYLKQRSQTQFNISSIEEQVLFKNLGFGTDALKQIITKNTIPIDKKREQGLEPKVLNDIYRSDLGELLMTYYFEEKLPDGERFVIPLKNITFRERAELPGRGLDAIGYRKIGDSQVEILLGEAKVSSDKKSPPPVVDTTKDSIYNTQLNHKNKTPIVIQRLSDYWRRLGGKDAEILGFAIISIEHQLTDNFSITYGCTLVRDHTCVNESSDFGKMKTNQSDFEPGKVHFSILSFSDKTIKDTVNLFYSKVQELIAN
ncbi:Hachiman antiphage defense system protein HamA [Flavobacterium sp.]|jgi:hypothetical protein|uniref:Hachiman antiphage defense system protein HamA n=2 Tax=Flavobacterium sp. TaxID=239 RepID=UPI0022BF9062|nr:Hachiman antiphage defense system protein HamA [Flavobacterium sp.]MCZ8143808.1 SAVED domain-containing protein [Flavobacterium sp.]MCZ8367455.1 SAVED domain-containing protein [Flavobacterium sp.]